MIPVLEEDIQWHFVSGEDMERFIKANSNIQNPGEFMESVGIVSPEHSIAWCREVLEENDNNHDPEVVYWMLAFLVAHPWIKHFVLSYV